MDTSNMELSITELAKRCREIDSLSSVNINLLIRDLVQENTLLKRIIIIVKEDKLYDHVNTTKDEQKITINTTYTEFKNKENEIKIITKFISVMIYFVCCSKLNHKCSICRTLKNSICHFRWESGGKPLSIIYSDFSVPEEIVLNRTKLKCDERMFLIGNDSKMYKSIENISKAGIKNIRVKRLPSSANLKVDDTYKVIIRNEKKESAYVIKTINNVTYHIFSFHLSELTKISANKEQTINFLKNAGVNDKDSKIMADLPNANELLPTLVRRQSSLTGTIDAKLIQTEITRAQTVGAEPVEPVEPVNFSPMELDLDDDKIDIPPPPPFRRS